MHSEDSHELVCPHCEEIFAISPEVFTQWSDAPATCPHCQGQVSKPASSIFDEEASGQFTGLTSAVDEVSPDQDYEWDGDEEEGAATEGEDSALADTNEHMEAQATEELPPSGIDPVEAEVHSIDTGEEEVADFAGVATDSTGEGENDSGETPAYTQRPSSSSASTSSLILAAVLGPVTVILLYFLFSLFTGGDSKKDKKKDKESQSAPEDKFKGLSERNKPLGRTFQKRSFRSQDNGAADDGGAIQVDRSASRDEQAQQYLKEARRLRRSQPERYQTELRALITRYKETSSAQVARTLLASELADETPDPTEDETR